MNSDESDTPNNESATQLYNALRHLAVRDPRLARQRFAELVDGDPEELLSVLTRLAAPGEGRLRQLFANFARGRHDRITFAEHFNTWLSVETDQFARRAIEAALDSPPAQKESGNHSLANRDLVEMYRYVSERMRHELQNALLGPQTRLLQLLEAINRQDEGITRAELESILAKLQDEFQSLGRMAEFEPDDTYFKLRPVPLCDWIAQMNREYAKRYQKIGLQFSGTDEAQRQHVLGSDYLLRLIFWNLWLNAHQAVEKSCEIIVQCDIQGPALIVTVNDNGPGFSAEMEDIAFRDRYSERAVNRGRGLLEVQDAIQQLHGDAQLIEANVQNYRVQLTFSTKTP